MGKFLSRDWDSSNDDSKRVTKDWESSDIKKRTAADRIRESARQAKTNFTNKVKLAREEAREAKAYKRSPEGREMAYKNRQASLKELKQQYQYESTKTKLAKVKGQRRKAQLDSLGMMGMGNQGGFSLGGGGFGKPSYTGFDSMFGFGGEQRTSKKTSYRKSGFDEMFGF